MHKGPEFFLTDVARRRAVALRTAVAFATGMACAALALAGPGQDAPRMDKMPGMSREVVLPRAELARQEVARQDVRAFDEQRRVLQAQQAQQAQQQAQQQADAYRRAGHLTADERLELRRQINEVGQDIYVNKRRR